MKLIWKLLRQHVSPLQMLGFFLANLFGMIVVLFAIQFYSDVSPVFTSGDSFMKKDFIIVTKKISTLGNLTGKSNVFSEKEISEIEKQTFTKSVGTFQSTQFTVAAGIGMPATGIRISTEMFFESVPDEYVDVNLDNWHFDEDGDVIPVVIPRNYLNLYNFGFAQARNLPKLSEGIMSMIQFDVFLRGNGYNEKYKGNIVGFSNRLNTILVPDEFMNWANNKFAPNEKPKASRLIVEVNNLADESMARFIQDKGYETEDDKLDTGKMSYFLKSIIGIVLFIGLLITALSFYILMLSIYLLLQKNTNKLENLLLIGYSPEKVAFPYQMLTIILNAVVFLISIILIIWIRSFYLNFITTLLPGLEPEGIWLTILIGLGFFVFVSMLNVVVIRKKIKRIWMYSE